MHTRNLALVLRILAFVVSLVGALHLALGVRADVLLGARAPAAAITDPTLDSQGRFHGVSFAVYGVLLLLGASDVRRYAAALGVVGNLRRRARAPGFRRDLRVSAPTRSSVARRRAGGSTGIDLVAVTGCKCEQDGLCRRLLTR